MSVVGWSGVNNPSIKNPRQAKTFSDKHIIQYKCLRISILGKLY